MDHLIKCRKGILYATHRLRKSFAIEEFLEFWRQSLVTSVPEGLAVAATDQADFRFRRRMVQARRLQEAANEIECLSIALSVDELPELDHIQLYLL